MTQNLFVDLHILQSVPPSNLNRDDTGSPKQAIYGGVRRARVSSQAWKRATRIAFTEHTSIDQLATRTKKISTLLTERLSNRVGLEIDQATRLANALLVPLGIKPSKKNAEDTSYLLFFGRAQLDAIVDLIADRATELIALTDEQLAAAAKDIPLATELTRGHPIDVALFGRMVADIPSLNVDAATQVAHALSTHAVELEFDYYTAVDDENTANTGAGMIGTVEFNSATLYRYATVAVHQLSKNLTDPTAVTTAVDAFVDAFTRSMPTGHQNSFAHRTLPHLAVVALRTDQPINLVSAFEAPVKPMRAGIAHESAQRLAEEFTTTNQMWAAPPSQTLATYATTDELTSKLTEAFGASMPFPQLRQRVHTAVGDWLAQDAQ